MIDKEKEQEIWKTHPEYPFIEANQFGQIRTKDRVVKGKDGKKYHIKGRVLKQWLNLNGYVFVHFKMNGKQVHLYVHRIVATCFVSNPNGYPEVNHIDCDPTNNRWDNLEWCSHQENIVYRDKLGHYVNNNPGHPVIAVNQSSFEVFWFESQSEAARRLGVCQKSVSDVTKGKLNKTGGFCFCDANENAVEKVRDKFGDEIARKVEKLICENCNQSNKKLLSAQRTIVF